MNRANSGFTLVEVAVAIAILGVALVALVGLHTDNMGTYINERNRVQAALAAKQIMSIIEADNKSPGVGSEERELADVLKDLAVDEIGAEQKLKEKYAGWTYEQEVQSLDLPLVEDAMRRVDITIRWGDRINEQFVLTYFMRTTPGT